MWTTGPKPAPGGAARERVEGEVKFLVCVDRRPQSRVAVRFACRRARNLGGRVSLLHVVGAAAPTDKSFSLITFLAGKLLGHLSVPLIVIPGNLTDEEIIALT